MIGLKRRGGAGLWGYMLIVPTLGRLGQEFKASLCYVERDPVRKGQSEREDRRIELSHGCEIYGRGGPLKGH